MCAQFRIVTAAPKYQGTHLVKYRVRRVRRFAAPGAQERALNQMQMIKEFAELLIGARLRRNKHGAPHTGVCPFHMPVEFIEIGKIHVFASVVNNLTSGASSVSLTRRSNLKPILFSSFCDASLSGEVMASTRASLSVSPAWSITAAADSKA